MPIPPYINDFVDETLDDEFELFLMQYYNNSEDGICSNYSDFINGFTFAISYLNRDTIPKVDHKWLRIKSSMVIGNILYKLTT